MILLVNWIVENPGRQMFTGSFHPIEDSKWEGREYWDDRIPSNYRFMIVTPLDALVRRKGLRFLFKTTMGINSSTFYLHPSFSSSYKIDWA